METKSTMEKRKKRISVIRNGILILALIGLIFMFDDSFNPYNKRIFNTCCIYAICALSMNMVNGFTGLFSLGQPGFMAIGAYVTAILTVTPSDKISLYKIEPISDFMANLQAPFFVALIIGGLVAAFFAFLVGFPVLRLKGDYLAIATLGFSEIIRIFITNAQGITNGPTGINRIPAHINMWVSVIILAIIVLLIMALMHTSYGRALKSIREDEVAAQAMGINLFKNKMLAFILSGFIAGIGGGMLASLVGAIGPDQFKFTLAYEILLMVVLGGQGSVSGSIAGAFIVRIALEKLRFLDEPIDFGFYQYKGIGGMRMVVFSVLLMIVIILWRRGIFGSKELSWAPIDRFIAKLKNKKAPEKGGVQ